MLYLIPFLHQTTTTHYLSNLTVCCILFHFYIKPQHLHSRFDLVNVVSYSISTSNHNNMLERTECFPVVSYSISTSNHNYSYCYSWRSWVVSYSISTSNHNILRERMRNYRLYLIPFLHQTTTEDNREEASVCCILFHFYIKPQRLRRTLFASPVVSYSISTSNHNE